MDADFPPCVRRQKLTTFSQDGTKAKVWRCMEGTAEKANQDVIPADCIQCAVRLAVLKSNEDYRPPFPVPKGLAKRPDTEPRADGFIPCDLRLVAVAPTCCGGTKELRICDNDEAHHYKGEVTPVICSQCPVRRDASKGA